MCKKLFVLFLMCIVAFAGPGMTWMEHYCSPCKETGMVSPQVASDCCCAPEQETAQASCCADGCGTEGMSHSDRRCPHTEDGRCLEVEHLSFDWESTSSSIHLAAASFVLPYLTSNIIVPKISENSVSDIDGVSDPPFYLYDSQRDYLTFIRVLLI